MEKYIKPAIETITIETEQAILTASKNPDQLSSAIYEYEDGLESM